MELYNDTCLEFSKLITTNYSTSFSRGISAFDKNFIYPIYAIYGFVRYADEIVDTFYGHNQYQLINEFKQQAFKAIKDKVSLNPVLHSFQMIVNTYGIEESLIYAFLNAMEMDLDHKVYDDNTYKTYIYGSAEVVGLMCLRVFCKGNEEQYLRLLPLARNLGAAFQKINFLRDIKADYKERGRVYFPGVDFNNFTNEDKKRIEADIKINFIDGLKGIKQLPNGAKLGVYIAYSYYRQLLNKISKTPATTIMQKRIRITNATKAILYLKAVLQYKLTGLN